MSRESAFRIQDKTNREEKKNTKGSLQDGKDHDY